MSHNITCSYGVRTNSTRIITFSVSSAKNVMYKGLLYKIKQKTYKIAANITFHIYIVNKNLILKGDISMKHDLTIKELKDLGFDKMIYANTLGVSGIGTGYHHKVESAPRLTTLNELYEYGKSLYDTDLKYYTLNSVVAVLLAAKKDGNEDIMNKCLDRIITASQTLSGIRYAIQKKYIRYGVDELRYVYDKYTINEVFALVAWEARKEWLKYSENNLLQWFDGTIQYQQTKFVSSFFSVRVQDCYKKWLWKEAKISKYPNLSMKSLQLYVKIRKKSGYKATLGSWTCAELHKFCEDNGIATTYAQVACMLRQFGYEVPEPENKPLHERPEWKRTHRNELLFWKQTEANKIEEEELRSELRRIQQEMQFSNEEMACLYNWVNIARYEGRAENTLPAIPETLNRRYRVKTTDTDVAICRRVRKDIVETFGKDSSRVINVFSRNLGGRCTTVAKDMEL